MNNKTNELNLIKQNILEIKKLSEKSNISSKELKLLFQENNLNFWEEEYKEILGTEEKYIISESTRKEEKILNAIDNELSNMSDKERNNYFKKMGFIIEEPTTSDLEELITPEEKKSVNKIIAELKEKLDSMTDEELEAHLRELGFFQDTMPNNIKEHAQRNKKIVKIKKRNI